MTYDLFDSVPYIVNKLIMDMKYIYMENGGLTENFHTYMKEQGVVFDANILYIPDELITMARLKFE